MKTATVILAAGHGTRMKSALPKVLHQVGGLPMLGHVIRVSEALHPERLCVVVGEHAPQVGEVAQVMRPGTEVFVQSPPQGTGDAVTQALPGLAGFEGVVFVLYADTPLVTVETLQAMAVKIKAGASVAVLGFRPDDPLKYGRLVTSDAGALEAIVEYKDATSEQRQITLCNSGVMAISSDTLFRELPKIDNKNAKGEYYLTDIVALAKGAGAACAVVEAEADEVLGVDSRAQLAKAEAIFQDRIRAQMMTDGVTLRDPGTVYFSWDTVVGQDVTIGQHVVFENSVRVADGADIKAFSHLDGATVGAGASIGPYARLRPGAAIGEDCKVGNFVEIKNADLAKGAKVSHLSYIGDAHIGADSNIGAGTITCNYDGFDKFKTHIGDGAFIGSNTALVAPLSIGDGAIVGAGSVMTKDVDADALAVGRGRQKQVDGWAHRFRIAKRKNKPGDLDDQAKE